ncbi:hypothetical protein ES319_A10G136800v1 [Gossypium barbadense]|uniref:Beta-galactosidase n=1 Tax=Gossypium barbadense TaxID=3634 RepID=A0A5J5U4Q3_GOSBA|nr:hypothetical protein ES319_A10G136800v1 [Gossypium barbadense]
MVVFENKAILKLLLVCLFVQFSFSAANFFRPFNVTYDHRALIIDGKRRMLISGGIHYPRATPQMWPDLIAKSKEGGADVIESYTFWNGHEPVRGQYNFEGRFDLVKFVKLVGDNGLYFLLRIGPYVCAEWNFGGFPVWLRDIPGIEFRTDNEPFKREMQRFVTKIVDLMREEKLFSWQGGPIILLQIENEYGNMEGSYGQKGKEYVKWAANMALGLGAGVPWVMCKQTDAPGDIIDTCNNYYCDGYKPNSPSKPTIWTENWDGWYTSWGGRLPHRPVEDLAFAVARFFQRGGSLMNYYMYFGGTNFGRTSGGPFYITSLRSEPKWGHLKDLHAAIKLCERALVAADSPQYMKLGPRQEAHIYWENTQCTVLNTTLSESQSACSAFLANIDEHNTVTVTFRGKSYSLPPWSVSILPDCSNVAFNTAKVGAQTSVKLVENALSPKISAPELIITKNEVSSISESWMSVKEPIGIWSESNFTVQGLLEHLKVTKDESDYLWHMTRIYVSDDDVAFWEENKVSPTLVIDSMRDVLRIFINGELMGSVSGHWVKVVQPVQFQQGYSDLMLLSQTVGLQVGLKGEFQKIFTIEENEKAGWTNLKLDATPSTFTWYKAYFDSPDGSEPIAIDLGSMGKGQAWVNDHHIGRYWNLTAPKDGCPDSCDYRGTYGSNKCMTNCGKPTQTWYHVPRSWLQASNNLLVIFEEIGGNPFEISVKLRVPRILCAQMSKSYYPPLREWLHLDLIDGKVSISDMKPQIHLQCEDGQIISSIEFASYGTPHGSCQNFSKGNCHSPNSLSVVSEACVGRNSCSVEVSNSGFGSDPCRGVLKTLAVEARCVSTSTIGVSQF